MVLIAKYPNTCPKCRHPIEIGDRIHWSPGMQPTHVSCPAASAPVPTPAAPPPPPLSPRLQKLEMLHTLFELFGEAPTHTHNITGEALLLHIRGTPRGPQRLAVLVTEDYIWYVAFPPDTTPNVFHQGTLGGGRRLGYTKEFADYLSALRLPGSEGLAL
jgi:hypothetical protein